VVDLSLPDETGERILKAIRAEGRPIRVVVCTGCDDPERLAALRRLKPDAVLVKPVDPVELVRACEDGD
jgi:DNA-binding NarL/FixJ family response regulator